MEENTTSKKQGGMNPAIIAVLVIIVVAGLGYVLMKQNKSNTEEKMEASATIAPTEAMKPDNGAMMGASATPEAMTGGTTSGMMNDTNSNTVTVDLEAGSFYFKPTTMKVKKGQKVKVVMKAVSMMHDFNIDELNVHMKTVKNGETGSVEFTADKAGIFEYYCSVGQHRKLGQVGRITVE